MLGRYRLQAEYEASRILYPGRFCVYSPESIIKDLSYCISNTKQKSEKRIKRLRFALPRFANVSNDIKVEAYQLLEQGQEDEEFELVDDFNINNVVNYRDQFTGVFKNAKTSAEYVEPATTPFHNHVKNILNHDGSVYDVFTEVAVISFSRFLQLEQRSNLELRMMLDAKLIFKGGASVGKFIFGKMKLSKAEDQFVYDHFIKGGDNDTSIKFSELPEESAEVIDTTSKQLLRIFMDIMNAVILEFDVVSIIGKNLRDVEQSVMEYKHHDFTFNVSKGSNFEIVKTDDGMSKLQFFGKDSKTLYTTLSELEFNNGSGDVKFFLGRIKACMQATATEGMISEKDDGEFTVIKKSKKIGCFGECLDVTVMGAESYEAFKPTYVCI